MIMARERFQKILTLKNQFQVMLLIRILFLKMLEEKMLRFDYIDNCIG